jgi:hypothetical protein
MAGHNFADVPRDPFLMVSMSLAHHTCAYLGDAPRRPLNASR